MLYGQRGGNALLTSRPVRLSDGRPTFEPLPDPPADDMGGEHTAPGTTTDGTGTTTTDATAPAAPTDGTPRPRRAPTRATPAPTRHSTGQVWTGSLECMCSR